MSTRKCAPGIGLVCTLVMSSLLALPYARAAREDDAKLAQAEREARAALDGFYEAFNKADNDELQEFCNYPHAFVGAAGSIRVIEDRWEMNFERLREREGWAKSTLDSAEAFLIKEDKVHFNLTFSRHKADGTIYRTVSGLWIMTKQDGRWGLSLRSY